MGSLVCTVIRREVPADALVARPPGPARRPGPRSAAAAVRIACGDDARTRRSRPSRPAGVHASAREVLDGADQRGADGVVVLGEHAELAVVAAELLAGRGRARRAGRPSARRARARAAAGCAAPPCSPGTGRGSPGRGAEQRGVEVPSERLGLRGRRRSKLDRMIATMPDLAALAPLGDVGGEQLFSGHRSVGLPGRGARDGSPCTSGLSSSAPAPARRCASVLPDGTYGHASEDLVQSLSGTHSTFLTLCLGTSTADLSSRRTRGMDSFNPTTKTQQAISAAVQAAALAGNPDVGPTHLLGALLAQGDGIAAPLLAAVGADAAAVRGELTQLGNRLPSASGSTVSAPAALPRGARRDQRGPAARHRDGRRVRLHRAPARRAGRRRRGPVAAAAAPPRRHPGGAARGLRQGPRLERGSRAPTPRAPTRRWRSTASTSPSGRARASSTR